MSTSSKLKLESAVSDGSGVAAVYGSDDEVVALASRIEALHPKAELMGADGCLYMAQIAIATGARALPAEANEIQVWHGDQPGELIFDLGFDFHNRIAWESGGYTLAVTPKSMNDAERNENGVPPEAHYAYRCVLVRMSDLERLQGFGVKFTDMAKGTASWEGVAVVTKSEMDARPAPVGRTWAWRCKRRAIKDAIRLAFGTSAKVFTMDRPTAAKETRPESNGRTDLKQLNEDLFG